MLPSLRVGGPPLFQKFPKERGPLPGPAGCLRKLGPGARWPSDWSCTLGKTTPGLHGPVLLRVPSKDSSLLDQKRNLEAGASARCWVFQHYPTADVGAFPFRQPLEFHNRSPFYQGRRGVGGWAGMECQGKQALLANPLKKRHHLSGESDATFFPLHLRPKATGVLLTSHKKRLMPDSSDGNESARGPGSELG